jgi:hypothetical protein
MAFAARILFFLSNLPCSRCNVCQTKTVSEWNLVCCTTSGQIKSLPWYRSWK